MKFPSFAAFLFANSGHGPSGNVGVISHRDPSVISDSISRAIGKPLTVLSMSDPVADAFSSMNSQMVQNDQKALQELQELSASFKRLAESDTSSLFGGMRVAKGNTYFEPDIKKRFSSMETNIASEKNHGWGTKKQFASRQFSGQNLGNYAGAQPSSSVAANTQQRFSNMEKNIVHEKNLPMSVDVPKDRYTNQEVSDNHQRFTNMEQNILHEKNLPMTVNAPRERFADQKSRLVGPDPKDTAEIRETIRHGFRTPSQGHGGMDPAGAPSFNPPQNKKRVY